MTIPNLKDVMGQDYKEPASTGAPSAFPSMKELLDEPSDTSGGALAGAGKAVSNFFTGFKDLYDYPEQIIPALRGAGEGITQAITHPLNTARAVIVDGIVKPFIEYPIELAIDKNVNIWEKDFGKNLSDADRFERGKEITANLSGLLIGGAIGKALGATTKAGNLLRVVKPSSLDEITKLVSALPEKDLLKLGVLSSEVGAKKAIGQVLLEGTAEGVTGGVTTGFMQGDTPEERFSNAVQYGFAGAVLGNAFEILRAPSVNRKLSNIKTAVRNSSIESTARTLVKNLEPVDAAKFAEDLLKDVSAADAFVDNVPIGQTTFLYNLEKVSDRVKNAPNTSIFNNPDGTFNVAIEGNKQTRLSDLGPDAIANLPTQDRSFSVKKTDLLTNELLPDKLKQKDWNVVQDDLAIIHSQFGDISSPEKRETFRTARAEYTMNNNKEAGEVAAKMLRELPQHKQMVAELKKQFADDQTGLLAVYRAGEKLDNQLNSFSLEPRTANSFKTLYNETNRQLKAYHVRPEDVEFIGTPMEFELVVRGNNAIPISALERILRANKSAELRSKSTVPGPAVKEAVLSPVLESFKKGEYAVGYNVLHDGKEYKYISKEGNKSTIQSLATGKTRQVLTEQLQYPPMINEVSIFTGPEGKTRKAVAFKTPVQPYLEVVDTKKRIDFIRDQLPLSERDIYDTNLRDLEQQQAADTYSAAEVAGSKGLYLKTTDAGKVEIIDYTRNSVVATVDGAKQAQDFIAQYKTSNADYVLSGAGDGAGLPPSTPGAMKQFEPSDLPGESGKAGKFLDKLNASYLSKLIPRGQYFKSFENTFRHLFNKAEASFFGKKESVTKGILPYNDVFVPTQQAAAKAQAVGSRYSTEVAALATKSKLVSRSLENRQAVLDLVQRRSPTEFETKGYNGKRLTQSQLTYGKSLAASAKDSAGLERAYKYRAARAQLAKQYKSATRRLEELKKWTQAEYPNFSADDYKTVALLDEALNSGNLEPVSAYARSILNQTLDEATFIKQRNLPDEVVSIAKQFEDYFNKTSTARGFGGDAHKLFNDLIHVLNFDEGFIEGSDLLHTMTETQREFYRQIRQVELSNFAKDPFDLLMKYIRVSVDQEHLAPVVDKARDALQEGFDALKEFNPPAAYRYLENGNQYLHELRHGPNSFDATVKAAFYKSVENLTPQVADKTRVSFVNTFMRIVEFAAQGFKPLAGVRDASSFLSVVGIKYGPSMVARMMRDFDEVRANRQALKEVGLVPGLAPGQFETGAELAASRAAGKISGTATHVDKFFQKLEESGFKASLQPTVYEMAHTAVYIERTKRFNEAVTNYVSKKFTRKQFDSHIDFDLYDPAVRSQVDKLLQAGDFKKASDYFARTSAEEIVGYYGMANHPMFMASKYMKLFGQFGQWPIWMANVTARMMTNASPARRAAIAARMTTLSAAFAVGGTAVGMNLNNWRVDPIANVYAGSPAADIAFWMLKAGSPYAPTREFAQRQLMQYANFDNPRKIYIPVPFQVYDVLEAGQRIMNGDPAHVAIWKLVGGSVDTEQYPRP